MSSGNPEAKEAIAKKYSHPDHPIDPNNVFLTFGCSGALYCAMSALCEEGDNILVPSPGFPLCLPIAQNTGVHIKQYDLLVNKIHS